METRLVTVQPMYMYNTVHCAVQGCVCVCVCVRVCVRVCVHVTMHELVMSMHAMF